MRNDKNFAIKLRKQGKSYNEISRTLKIAKSTLSYWLRDLKLSENAESRIKGRYGIGTAKLIERNKKQTIIARERADIIIENARKEVAELKGDPLFLIGTSLYWAEGYKKGLHGSKWKCVNFTNSDPEMVQLMMKYFRTICEASDDKIRIQLIAHPNIDINKAVSFWSKLTGIPKKQFIKTSLKISTASKGKRNINTLRFGTIHIRIYSVKLFFRIMGWIEGMKKGFIRAVVYR